MQFEESNGTIIYCNDYCCEKYNNGSYNPQCKDHHWYYKGYMIHREDGPAIKYSNEFKMWFLNGIEYSEESHLKIMNLKNKQKVLNEI